ncbi:MAG: CPBP family intramembrane glutamic endopeptidase [Hyphomonadaceae bacterium]
MNIVRRHPLTAFVVIAYGLSWLTLGPFVYLLQVRHGGEFQAWMLVFLPGAWGPTLAAFLVTTITSGRAGLGRLLKSFLDWRHNILWWAFVVLAPPATFAAAMALSNLGLAPLGTISIAQLAASAPLFIALALPFGPLGEEFGWRGFATPRFLESGGAVRAALLIGTIWTFWHLPLFWLPGASIPEYLGVTPFSIAAYWAYITGLTLIYTAIWLHTNGSVLIAVVFHAMCNASENILLAAIPGEIADSDRAPIYLIGIAISWAIGVPMLALSASRARALRLAASST